MTSTVLQIGQASISDQCACACAQVLSLRLPAATIEVLVGTYKRAAVCTADSTLLIFSPPPLFFREPWLQAGVCAFSGLQNRELCV